MRTDEAHTRQCAPNGREDHMHAVSYLEPEQASPLANEMYTKVTERFEGVQFKSADGTRLSGILFPSSRIFPRG